jgi:hypothetical protein
VQCSTLQRIYIYTSAIILSNVGGIRRRLGKEEIEIEGRKRERYIGREGERGGGGRGEVERGRRER